MAILRIFRPALASLLLLLALSQEAPQEALWGTPQDAPGEAPREAKKGVKCKDPKVNSILFVKKKKNPSPFMSGIRGRLLLRGLLQVHLYQGLEKSRNLG